MTEPLEAARAALAGEDAWLVGGAVRDELLGRPTADFDVAVAGDPAQAASRVARAARGTSFQLSGEFGAWRVVGRDQALPEAPVGAVEPIRPPDQPMDRPAG